MYTNNTTTNTTIPPSNDDDNAIRVATTSTIVIEVLTLTVLWLLSVVGNTLVCVVIRRSRRIQSTTNYFIVSLAVADLSFSLICAPFVAAEVVAGSWLAGRFLCKLVRFVQYAAPSLTVFVLLSICVDRFYTIIYPLCFKVTRGTAKRMIICCFLSAIILSSLCFYFFDLAPFTQRGPGRHGQGPPATVAVICPTLIPITDWGSVVYVILLLTCQFALPVIVVGALYARVVAFTWTVGPPGVRVIQRTCNPVPCTKVRMVKMLLAVTASTLVMMTPFYLLQLVYCVRSGEAVERTVFNLAFWFLAATASAKPLLYLYCNANFRRGCKEVLCMSAMRCYRYNTYTITTASVVGKKNHVGVVDTSRKGRRLGDAAYDSPLKAFNTALYMDKAAWHLNGSFPSSGV